MKGLARIYLIGILILVIAIIADTLAELLGFSTWYRFIQEMNSYGLFYEMGHLSFFSAVFLFLLYPLILGLSLFIAKKLLESK